MQPTDSILNPTVFLGSFEWREPVTTLTDFLVAMVCLTAFISYQRYKGERNDNYRLFQLYFLCFAIGMTSAAWFGHGLQAYVGPEFKRIGWACSATGHLFLAFATLQQIKPLIQSAFYQFIKLLIPIQYLIFMVLMLHPTYSDFIYAQISSTAALVGMILPMHVFNFIKTKQRGSLIIFCAIIYGIIPGTVYNNQISISNWFNYHDISHVLMAIFMTAMFIGTRKLARK